MLLGASIADFVGLVLLRKAFTLYLHANLPWTHGPLGWLLASPSWHALHHDADRCGDEVNFAGTFPFVDALFGTHRAPEPRAPAHGPTLTGAAGGPPEPERW